MSSFRYVYSAGSFLLSHQSVLWLVHTLSTPTLLVIDLDKCQLQAQAVIIRWYLLSN